MEIKELRAELELKEKQIIAIAQKIETIVIYLKNKDLDEINCDEDQKFEAHELDEDINYDEKINYMAEHEDSLEIFDEKENDNIFGLPDFSCYFCENIFETEIRLVSHIWKDHKGKSTFILVPKMDPS